MSLCLTTSDWMMVTRIIYRINSLETIEQAMDTLPELLKAAVPFSWGTELLMSDGEQLSRTFCAETGSQPSAEQRQLIEELPDSTYMRSLQLDRSARVLRGPSRTELDGCAGSVAVPDDPDRALTMPLHHKDTSLGHVVLFADEEHPFSGRSHCMLEELQPHLSLHVSRLIELKRQEHHGGDALASFEHATAGLGLTKRECELLFHLVQSESDEEVCEKLFISKSTFKKHLNHIYQKCGVRNRAELLRIVPKG